MKHALKLGAVSGLLLAGVIGCSVPKVMLTDSFLPGTNKAARELVKVVGSSGSGKDKVVLSNYYVQICDVNGTEQSNCRTTLVLENITNYVVAR